MKTQVKKRESAGRPPATIDWKKVGRYLQAQCKTTEIAGILGISPDTLYTRCPQDNKMEYTAWSALKKAEGIELIRAKQFDTAMAGDRTMLIWLGKQLLGQKDQVENTFILPELKVQPLDQVEQDRINKSLEALNESNADIHPES
jgi:hypothetical protein